MNSAILLQIPQFILNIIFISIFIHFHNVEVSVYSNYYGYQAWNTASFFTLNYGSIILILNFIHIYFCYNNWSGKIRLKEESKLNERISGNEFRRSSIQFQSEMLTRSKDEKEEKGEENTELSNTIV